MATFAFFLALCVALVALLDVELVLLAGPAIAIGVSAYGVYRGAVGAPRPTPHAS